MPWKNQIFSKPRERERPERPDIWKDAAYFFGICAALSIWAVYWLDGVLDFGAAKKYPFTPFFAAFLVFAWTLHPLLHILNEYLAGRMRQRSYLNLFIRGLVSGGVMLGVCASLYTLGCKYAGHEGPLIVAAYTCSMVVGILGVALGKNVQN